MRPQSQAPRPGKGAAPESCPILFRDELFAAVFIYLVVECRSRASEGDHAHQGWFAGLAEAVHKGAGELALLFLAAGTRQSFLYFQF